MAASSLTYSWETGTNSSGTVPRPGPVNASTIDCYYNADDCLHAGNGVPSGINQTLAHTYGESASTRTRCFYQTDADIFGAPQNCTYFSNQDTEFAFRYREFNPSDLARSYPYLTNRVVKASPGQCSQYDVDERQTQEGDSTDGQRDTWIYNFNNDEILAIPKVNTAVDSTTYVYNGTDIPQVKNSPSSCGSRCIWLYAYRATGQLPERPSHMFRCPITITNVSNTNHPAHELPEDMARVAAASIALTGRWRVPPENNEDWRQYQLYSFGSVSPLYLSRQWCVFTITFQTHFRLPPAFLHLARSPSSSSAPISCIPNSPTAPSGKPTASTRNKSGHAWPSSPSPRSQPWLT